MVYWKNCLQCILTKLLYFKYSGVFTQYLNLLQATLVENDDHRVNSGAINEKRVPNSKLTIIKIVNL